MQSKLPSLLVVWVAWIGYSDWRYRRIPNVLSLGAWVVGIGLLILKQTSLLGATPSSALYAAGFGLLVTYPAYLMRKLGAGDVKLLVAMGLLTSLPITIKAFMVAAFSGAIIALVWLSVNWWAAYLPARLTQPGGALGQWLAIPVRDRRMAYGTLLAAGLISSLWMERT